MQQARAPSQRLNVITHYSQRTHFVRVCAVEPSSGSAPDEKRDADDQDEGDGDEASDLLRRRDHCRHGPSQTERGTVLRRTLTITTTDGDLTGSGVPQDRLSCLSERERSADGGGAEGRGRRGERKIHGRQT